MCRFRWWDGTGAAPAPALAPEAGGRHFRRPDAGRSPLTVCFVVRRRASPAGRRGGGRGRGSGVYGGAPRPFLHVHRCGPCHDLDRRVSQPQRYRGQQLVGPEGTKERLFGCRSECSHCRPGRSFGAVAGQHDARRGGRLAQGALFGEQGLRGGAEGPVGDHHGRAAPRRRVLVRRRDRQVRYIHVLSGFGAGVGSRLQ